MTGELRNTGISVLGNMPWGTHFCLFYETKQDLLDALVPYFKAGLEAKELCVWVIAEPLTEEEARDALRQAVPDLDRHLANGDIEVFNGREWYQKGGRFELEKATNACNEKLAQALSRGYAGMRFSGDATWLPAKDWKNFCEYERQLNESIDDRLMIVFCTYSLSTSGAAELLDVARTHQFGMTRGGTWEIIETPELKRAKTELERLNRELEQRVADRTAQLTAINEEFRKEIIERERTEGLLREANERAALILDSITDRFFAFDSEWRFTYFNKRAREYLKALGRDPDSLIGKVYFDEFPVRYAEPAVRRAMSERVTVIHEFYFPPLKQWIEGRIYPSPDGGLAVYQRDITERKRAEEGLRRSESLIRCQRSGVMV